MRRIAEGVFQTEGEIVHVTRSDIAKIEDDAPGTQKLRSRILMHQPGDGVHQMLIAFSKGSSNPMHSHAKMESVFVISGALLVRFKDRPEIPLLAGDFLLIPGGIEHQPLPLSDCVILETAEK